MNIPASWQNEPKAERTHRSPIPLLRTAKFLGYGMLLAAFVYLVLLIPEPSPVGLAGAGKQPFLWQQDRFWAERETLFVQARAEGCTRLRERISTELAAIERFLSQCSGKMLTPEDPIF